MNTHQSTAFTMRTVKTVLVTIALVILVVTVMQNTQVVSLHFLIWDFSISQILLLPLVALMGFVVGLITCSLIARRGGRVGGQPR